MIEQIMFFALGALAATLVALMILPAVWNRAVRLTTRRVEAAVPVSIFEIQAAKDHQRAQFALNQRRLELRLEQVQARVAADARELEIRRLRIVDLERAVSAITAELGTLSMRFAAEEAALRERTDDLALTRTQLAATQTDLAAREAELSDARAALARTQEALAGETGHRETLEATLAAREATLAEQMATIARLDGEVAALSADLDATRDRAETLDAARAAAEATLEQTRLSTAAERAHLEAALARDGAALAAALALADTRAGIISRLEGEQRDLAAEFAATRNELSATRAVAQATETRRASEFAAAETEGRRLRDEVARLGAEISMMEGALTKARSERDDLLARGADMDTLRTSLRDLAARLIAGSAQDLQVSEDGTPPSSLAGRIRAVREETPAVPASGKKPASRRSAKG